MTDAADRLPRLHTKILTATTMAPDRWATPEQREWLEARVTVFRQHQDNCIVARFWTEAFRDWFEAYPEREALYPGFYGPLNEQETAQLSEKTKKRKKVSAHLRPVPSCQAHSLLLPDGL